MEILNPTGLADRGKQEYERGNFRAAAELFLQAAQAYTSARDELNAAEMKNNQNLTPQNPGYQ